MGVESMGSATSSDNQAEEQELSHLSLQIMLAATAVATSFALIFVPNVETITFTAFMVGFLFPLPFAIGTILTMTLTWEIFASMVFGFSGYTFPFKIVAWVLVGLLGNGARKIKARYFYEFAVFGMVAAFLFDILVTIPTAFIFLGDTGSFYTVLVANLIVGLAFTATHTLANAVLFSFMPAIFRTILPLLYRSAPEITMINVGAFDYLGLKALKDNPTGILKMDLPRISVYSLAALTMILLLVFGGVQVYNNSQPPELDDNDTSGEGTGSMYVNITLVIDYDGVKPLENHSLSVLPNQSLLIILEEIAVVNYTTDFGQPFLQAVNGVWQNDDLANHYWVYYVNDLYVNTGINNTYFDHQDLVELTYQ